MALGLRYFYLVPSSYAMWYIVWYGHNTHKHTCKHTHTQLEILFLFSVSRAWLVVTLLRTLVMLQLHLTLYQCAVTRVEVTRYHYQVTLNMCIVVLCYDRSHLSGLDSLVMQAYMMSGTTEKVPWNMRASKQYVCISF